MKRDIARQESRRFARRFAILLPMVILMITTTSLGPRAQPAAAQQPTVTAPTITTPQPSLPVSPDGPSISTPTTGTADSNGGVNLTLDLGGNGDGTLPSQSVVLLLLLTVLSVAPSLVVLLTSFTRIVIVFSLVRNALGLQTVPPNQVIVGLSLFLSLFVMAPTLSQMNEQGLQPYLHGEKSQGEAFDASVAPLRTFMLANTGTDEMKLMLSANPDRTAPETPDDVSLTALIPAFILSELKTAFVIGFVVFMPFLIIDLVVSSVLMSLGMMMLPPVFVSLPFKILLFLLVNGWVLIADTLINSFTIT